MKTFVTAINHQNNLFIKELKMKNRLLSFLIFTVSINVSHAQWLQQAVLSGLSPVPRISVADSNVVWVASGIEYVPKIYRTVNGGVNWVSIPTAGLPFFLTAIAAKDSLTAFVGDGGSSTFNGGNAKFYKTTNAGQNWLLIDSSGGNFGFMDDIKFSKSNPQFGIIVCDAENVIGGPFNLWKTTNSGLTWVHTYTPNRPNCFGTLYGSFAIDPQFYGFTVVNFVSLKVYPLITSNGGNNWYFGNDSMNVYSNGSLVFSDNKLHGIMVEGVELPVIKRTTDGGHNWLNVNAGGSSTQLTSSACWVSGSNVLFITSSNDTAGDILRSNDGGITWTAQNTSGIAGTLEIDYAAYGNRLICYAINRLGLVLKSRQTFVPIGIQPIANEIPSQFQLFQNYPNPFNPQTKIKFDIPKQSLVNMILYDILGREVATIINEELKPGTYEVEWNAGNYSSGVYFYMLTAGDFTETKKMILVK